MITFDARYYRMFPVDKPAGYIAERISVDPRRSAFLLIDVYGKGFDEDGDLGAQPDYAAAMVRANRGIVVDKIKPSKEAARSAGLPIVYVTNYLSSGLTEQSIWRNLVLRMRGIDPLQEWQGENDMLTFSKIIAPEAGDHVVRKQLFSGFFETHLDSLLRSLDVQDIIMVGFDSRVCLRATAIDAMYRNYRITVLRDCIGTYEYEETAQGGWARFIGLRELETICGYSITAQQWQDACQAYVALDSYPHLS